MLQKQTVHAHQNSIETFPVLPEGTFRSHVEGLLTDVSRMIGMSDALLRSLLTMIRYTAPKDWNDPTREPVCSKMQSDLAIVLGKTDRAVRNDERALEQVFGMIRKDVSANGSRRSDGNGYRQGLSFSPLIEMIGDLQAARERRRSEERQRKTLRLKCSALRRLVKTGLMALHPANPDHPGLCEIRDRYLGWAPRYAAYEQVTDLEGHYQEALETSQRLEEIREQLGDSSGPAEAGFRRYLHDTTESSDVICNAGVDNLAEGKPSDISDRGSPPYGDEHCREEKHGVAEVPRNLKKLRSMTLERLFGIASPLLQEQVNFCRGGREHLREMDFIHGVHGLLQPLGINETAYHDAVDQMGPHLTTLCLLVIDANRTHPVTPVRNPGGLLRAMTRKHMAGRLNIAGSLIGLMERLETSQ